MPANSGLARPLLGTHALQLVSVAVIVPVEQHDQVATGCQPCHADRLDHGRRRRERELPRRLGVPAAELARHRDAVLGGQQELGTFGEASRHCSGRRFGCVAGEGARVGQVEVDVVVPVDVLEVAALAGVDRIGGCS